MSDSIKKYEEDIKPIKVKSAIIEKIIKLTGSSAEAHFDTLHDKDVEYLGKLLNVCQNLKSEKPS